MSDALELGGWKTNSIGEKFSNNGELLPFQGNTLICHIPVEHTLSENLSEMADAFKRSGLGRCYSMLPRASYHMTVFNGANNSVRRYPDWPTDLALNTPMDVCNASFSKKLRSFRLEHSLPLRMRLSGVRLMQGIILALAPADMAENEKLRLLRDRLSDTLKCRRANHEVYEFHISVAYLVNIPTNDEIIKLQVLRATFLEKLMKNSSIIELTSPEFCTFDDMSHFNYMFSLK
jgi:hypothetical protein